MRSNIIIPSKVLQLWEEQAMRENLTHDEFSEFIKDQEREYLESLQPHKEEKKIFANDARNKLTEYGNRKALSYLLSIPQIERICKFAKFDFDDLQQMYAKVLDGKAVKENFLWQLEIWYKKLKDDMREYRLSKETMLKYGLDYKAATNFYFAAR